VSAPRRFTVRLAEGLRLDYELASPIARGAAVLVDGAALALGLALLRPLAGPFGVLGAGFSLGVLIAAYFALSTCYGFLSEWLWRGQTLGKRVFGLRVLDTAGRPLNAYQAVLRNLLRMVDRLPLFYGLGGGAAFLNGRWQRLGDLAAGTVVVRERRSPLPDWSALASQDLNSLRGQRRLTAQLRQACSPAEAELGLEMLLRRNQLEDGARLRLFAGLAARLKAKVSAPPELVEGLSDEQWVRAVVDVLYQAAQEEPGRAAKSGPKQAPGQGQA
jgi:uncharacterized RDD family membrane protein YckC